jgi:hypothetical protein
MLALSSLFSLLLLQLGALHVLMVQRGCRQFWCVT